MPSSVIAYSHYREADCTLIVGFVSGVKYEYKNVPPSVYAAFKKAKSKGTYLNKHIKGHFDYVKVD